MITFKTRLQLRLVELDEKITKMKSNIGDPKKFEDLLDQYFRIQDKLVDIQLMENEEKKAMLETAITKSEEIVRRMKK